MKHRKLNASSHFIKYNGFDLSNDYSDVNISDVEHDLYKTAKLLANNSHVTFHSDKYDGICTTEDYSHTDIHVGTKFLYDDAHNNKPLYKNLCATYKELFHELGHRDMFIHLGNCMRNEIPFDKQAGDIFQDIIIRNYIPEYELLVYDKLPGELYAEKYGIIHAMQHFQKSKLFKNDASIQQGMINAINSTSSWCNEPKVTSINDAIARLDNSDNRLIQKLSDIKQQKLTVYSKVPKSEMPNIRKFNNLLTYLNGAKTIDDLRKRSMSVIVTLHPEFLQENSDVFVKFMPDRLLPMPIKLTNPRIITNKPDFINTPEQDTHEYPEY